MWHNKYLIKDNGEKLFTHCFINDNNAPNIIYIQTPQILSVTDLKECYKPLAKYGFNIFALDLTGVGKSEGKIKNLTIQTLFNDISLCLKYIRDNYSGNVHFFGGTGTGGILAQAFVSKTKEITSFAQYGVAIYKDVSIYPNSRYLNVLYPLLKIFCKINPNRKLKFSIPSFSGKNAVKEDKLYDELLGKFPGGFDMNICLLTNVLGIFLDDKSPIRDTQACPTLFFAPQHDRYFSKEYFNKYYDILTGEKKMYIIDDAHSSYLWHAEEICKQVSDWFWKYN